MKKLIIVGNQLAKKDIFFSRFSKSKNRHVEQFVNLCDYVVRINLAPTFGKETGEKINCLAIINKGIPAIDFSYKIKINPTIIKNCKSVLFTRPEKNTESTLDLPSICKENMSKHILEYQKLVNKQTDFVSIDNFKTIKKIVGSEFLPSSGIMVINHFLTNKKFIDYEMYITGFSWEGWNGHNWHAEMEYIKQCEREGKLKILALN